LDDVQPDALLASARNVSIATELSRLVSSSVERWQLKRRFYISDHQSAQDTCFRRYLRRQKFSRLSRTWRS